MSSPSSQGIALATTVVNVPSLGFVPVAIHFDLFANLVQIGRPATPEEVTAVCNAKIRERSGKEPELGVKLAADTLFIMAGLGLVEQVSENVFGSNDITRYMIEYPSAQHGAFHFTTDAIFAAAFLYQKLKDTNFQYPLKEANGPVQYAHKLMGNEELSKKHTYSIMADEGRMDSFNEFMIGKFFKDGKMPEHIKGLGYDLDSAILGTAPGSVAMVDIGGGHGHLLAEIKEAYPNLDPSTLIVQDFYASVDTIPGLTLMKWNFKDTTPQPIRGARIYCLQHILHNLPDLEAIALIQKIAAAMTAESRLIVFETAKNLNTAAMHASMIALYGGRERNSSEWRQIAALAGLDVTFEVYPETGDCLVEMRRKVDI